MMILALANGRKRIAWGMLTLLYLETVVPAHAGAPAPGRRRKGTVEAARTAGFAAAARPATPAAVAGKKAVFNGGPTQPESQAFSSVNNDNMVDLFTGDFSYNIPLIDVGGYPLALGYNSGVSMDQEASWCGLGWNINPGSITRNMRGLPDDFNGQDTIAKTAWVKTNKTIGVTTGAGIEIAGFPKGASGGGGAQDSSSVSLNLSVNLGIFHNTYRGWGLEAGINPSINAGGVAGGSLSGGLGITTNSQEGLTLSPSLSYAWSEQDARATSGFGGNVSIGSSYNSRSGMKALQFSGGVRQFKSAAEVAKDVKAIQDSKKGSLQMLNAGSTSVFGSGLSFAYPGYTPTISMPFTNSVFTAMVKVGVEYKSIDPNFYIGGYVTKQYIADEDTTRYLPAYGYLHYQDGANNPAALMDYNREREIPYREKPEFPNIAVPVYTHDVFTMSGEGTGGTFRAYRSDVGYVFDHQMRTKDKSFTGNLDLGFGDLVHVGVDVSVTKAFTETSAWKSANPLASAIPFTRSSGKYEAAYFRNPGEKTINTRSFYDNIGGDDVVFAKLNQPNKVLPSITSTNKLVRYRGGQAAGEVSILPGQAVKKTRDKRTQVISYLTAEEASTAGFPKYIENYGLNKFVTRNCDNQFPADTEGEGVGWYGEYFKGNNFNEFKFSQVDKSFDFRNKQEYFQRQDKDYHYMGNSHSTVRWTGRVKAPVTGTYKISMWADDGCQLAVNNQWVLQAFGGENDGSAERICYLNLEAGEVYDIWLEYVNRNPEDAEFRMVWKCGETQLTWKDMYLMPATDTFEVIKDTLYKEKRVNSFRKKNHISQIDVLNTDGRRYVYGIPVYNLKQKEVTFAARKENGDPLGDTVKYAHGVDNTAKLNRNGIDNYYSSEITPAYAHSFLLSGVLSPDYVDATGDGISDDDQGDAIKFNYTKVAGIKNPFKWRTPNGYAASYNQGLRSENRDDKGSYVYGEKELWYLNSIESKTMIAIFKLEDRNDVFSVKENGEPELNLRAKKLTEINLYSKAEYLKRGKNARPIKTVHLEYEDALCPDNTYSGIPRAKLTLKSVYFSYNGNKKGKKNAYRFNYHANNPSYNANAFDRWGNYKDPMSNPGSATGNVVTNADYPYALQDSATAAYNAAAWALDSIILPSGGRIKVKYESDDYAFVQNKRAAQMFRVAGFSASQPTSKAGLTNQLYGSQDHLYVAVDVPVAVASNRDVWEKYLEGIDKMHFRLNVKMPGDKWGSGYDFVSGYSKLEKGQYGYIDANTIWFKMVPVDKKGFDNGPYSPMAKTAVQFLRLNLPSKAFRGSDVGDDIDLKSGVQMIAGMADNIVTAFRSFDESARRQNWAQEVDLTRAYVRLNTPGFKKLGGGHRVKQVLIYDNWKAMTGQKESIYGTEYTYTTTRRVNGRDLTISSGVAAYEPIIGGEENPWKLPLEYREQVASLAPTTLGYIETPLGESFFPAPTVGYSNVRARSIKTAKTRSANGFIETGFYTAYDFPMIVEHSLLDNNTKLRYNPWLTNLLQVNVMRHLVVSQGFKVELNDMHGKMRYRKVYSETDSVPIASTTYHYRLDNEVAEFKHLNNTAPAMGANGLIDTQTMIGKDMELMMDMRQQISISHAIDFNVNGDIFSFGIPPILGYPSFWAFPHRQENLFRSVAATKVINRHGIMDSIVVTDKGSRVSTRNLLFDAETGDAILTATQNEHDDPIYNFTYPAGWIYDGMSGAYKNIGTLMQNAEFREGRLITSLGTDSVSGLFASGDEILVYSQNNISANGCDPLVATFRSASVIWAVDANALSGGPANIFFLDKNGKPFSGSGVNLKVIRSGRKNISASAGSVTMLENPLKKNASGEYYLQIDQNSRIINAQMTEFKQNWQVEDRKREKIICLF
ncbi:PA14 domain-containing protein [Chitinophaga sp. 22620]|uniref:PA14 domain-containing protein n=1 Tax=Chitinophaga sp. 22620 TaxID=3453952 RepID=UPI003F83EA24